MRKKFREKVNEIKKEFTAMDIIKLTTMTEMEHVKFNDPEYIYVNVFGIDYKSSDLSIAKIELINEMMDFRQCQDGNYRFVDKLI